VTPSLWAWFATIAAISALVAVDIRHARSPHEVHFREALTWSAIYVAAAVTFGVFLASDAGRWYTGQMVAPNGGVAM